MCRWWEWSDFTRRLKEVKEAFEQTPTMMQHEGRLYLTEDEWEA
jgi:hypothetical protein